MHRDHSSLVGARTTYSRWGINFWVESHFHRTLHNGNRWMDILLYLAILGHPPATIQSEALGSNLSLGSHYAETRRHLIRGRCTSRCHSSVSLLGIRLDEARGVAWSVLIVRGRVHGGVRVLGSRLRT